MRVWLISCCSITHWSHLWLRVHPAGSHGAYDASTGIHVKVPPGQDHLCPTARLGHKLGGVGLERAAYRFTKINTDKGGKTEQRCYNLKMRENCENELPFVPEHGTERAKWGEALRKHLAQLDITHRVISGTEGHSGRRDQVVPLHL